MVGKDKGWPTLVDLASFYVHGGSYHVGMDPNDVATQVEPKQVKSLGRGLLLVESSPCSFDHMASTLR